jgi:hypothetical protein
LEVILKIKNSHRSEPGITLVEALVVVGALAVLVVMLLPSLSRGHSCSHCQRISCINNLKQIGTAFRIWEDDNGNTYPMEVSTNLGGTKEYAFGPEVFRHFQAMQNEMGQSARIVLCPEDTGRSAATNFINFNNANLSYFVGVTVSATNQNPDLFLCGDRNLTNALGARRGLFLLTTNGAVGWSAGIHGDKQMTAGRILFADGRVLPLRTSDLAAALRKPGVAPGPLAIP